MDERQELLFNEVVKASNNEVIVAGSRCLISGEYFVLSERYDITKHNPDQLKHDLLVLHDLDLIAFHFQTARCGAGGCAEGKPETWKVALYPFGLEHHKELLKEQADKNKSLWAKAIDKQPGTVLDMIVKVVVPIITFGIGYLLGSK